MYIYLVRHGDPDYEHDAITALGRKQMSALSKRFPLGSLSAIYSSPMGRALQSASMLAENLHMSVIRLPWVSELDLPSVQITSRAAIAPWDAASRIPRAIDRACETASGRGSPASTIPRINSVFRTLAQNSDAFFEQFGFYHTPNGYRDSGRVSSDFSIAVISHMGFGLTWLAYLLGLPAAQLWASVALPPSSVSAMFLGRDDWQDPMIVPVALSIGDVGHLHVPHLDVARVIHTPG